MALKIGDRLDYVVPVKLAGACSDEHRRRWSVVTAPAFRESAIERKIAELGYSTYVPRFRLEVRDKARNRATKIVERPLFCGYLFAQIDRAIDPWGEIERIKDVRGFVKVGEAPLAVPDKLIDALKAREPYNFDQPVRRIVLKLGGEVRIVDGPLTGFFAKLSRVDSDGRIAVLLELLRRMVTVELDVDQVERA